VPVSPATPLAAIGVALVILFVLCAIFAPWIAPHDPAHIDLPTRLTRPGASHWCGTDELGRDICSRLIYGARISMRSAAAWCWPRSRSVLSSAPSPLLRRTHRPLRHIVLMNAFLSFPGILLAIAFVAFRGPGIFNLVLALSLGGWVGYARLVRARCSPRAKKNSSRPPAPSAPLTPRVIVRHILSQHHSARHCAGCHRYGGRDPC